ncbi:hypothetical protein OG562_04285 [Streptomyces sp. NBC_01275]|uniref:hypothetical protein n=1 Tax=Streptomyces sp. NBC_01275 TaxID=2903807 RepID=UPI00224D7073|nr:hypothetical protein [Streptomyces sp. NBC_01275]MCX4760210.1 hypothetical protein [Streptomyces sp. NBC_01275]
MAESESWAVRSEGTADEVVLAVDFPGTGRPEAGFTDLAAKLDIPYGLWETLPPPLASGIALTGAEWIERWLEGVRESGRPVRAVMAFCAASPYAAILADRLGTLQGETPATVFFDPDVPQEFFLHWQYQMIMERFLTELTPEEKAAARARGEQARERATDITALGAELIGVFREYGAPACHRAGLDDEATAEYLAGFTTYVSFVCGSGQLATTEPEALVRGWSAATAVTSSGSGEAGRLVGKEVPFPDIAHADLLAHEKVAAAVSALLIG